MALYSVIGTAYGGDGTKTFAVPKLGGPPEQPGHWFIAVQGNFPARQ
jgi:microcystin-dependent protein